MTEDAEELIKCPSCFKKFFISTFKINRLGQRLRTCSGCLDRQKEERQKRKCQKKEPLCLHRRYAAYGNICKKCITQWRLKEEQIQAEEVLKRKHRPAEMALLETIQKQTKKVINTKCQHEVLDHLECTLSQFREYIEKLCQTTEDMEPPAKDTMNWGNFTVTPSKYWNQDVKTTPFKDRKWSIMPEILELKYTSYTPIWCSDWKEQLTVKKANRAELLKR